MAMFHVVVLRTGPQWDPARPLDEQADWAAHASFMNGLVDSGFIVLGGPLADEQPCRARRRGRVRGRHPCHARP